MTPLEKAKESDREKYSGETISLAEYVRILAEFKADNPDANLLQYLFRCGACGGDGYFACAKCDECDRCGGMGHTFRGYRIDATISKPETVAPNSSAPLTGWTRVWPSQEGWYWIFWDDRTPGFEYRRQVKPLFIGAEMKDNGPSSEIMFHAMQQPPEPPKATP